MITTILWLIGTVASFAFNSYMKGRADKRFIEGATENPPWVLGIMTCWIWPLQALLGAAFMVYHVASGAGSKSGLAMNQELHVLRQFAAAHTESLMNTMKALEAGGVDPNNIDAETKRKLVDAKLEESLAQDNPLAKKTLLSDSMYDVLDRQGYSVPKEYTDRRPKGPLDLS